MSSYIRALPIVCSLLSISVAPCAAWASDDLSAKDTRVSPAPVLPGAPSTVSFPPAVDDSPKLPRMMLNLRVAGAARYSAPLSLSAAPPQFGMELALAVSRSGHGYLFLPLGSQVGSESWAFSAGLGYQQDVPLPVRNLFLTARIALAYQRVVAVPDSSGQPAAFEPRNTLLLTPELGIKYAVGGRFNIGVELLSWQAEVMTERFTLAQRIVGTVGVNL